MRLPCVETKSSIRVIIILFDSRETPAMTDMTYDPEVDAVYIHLGRGSIDHQEENGPFICDVDTEGRVLGIEILSASKVLAPGEWQQARRPSRTNVDAAE